MYLADVALGCDYHSGLDSYVDHVYSRYASMFDSLYLISLTNLCTKKKVKRVSRQSGELAINLQWEAGFGFALKLKDYLKLKFRFA